MSELTMKQECDRLILRVPEKWSVPAIEDTTPLVRYVEQIGGPLRSFNNPNGGYRIWHRGVGNVWVWEVDS